jgi:hypothetical protein
MGAGRIVRTTRANSPEALAEALRSGLESRRLLRNCAELNPELPPIRLGGHLSRLLETAGLLGFSAPRSSRLAGVMRLFRVAVKRLMTPWLDRQTQFNHVGYEVLHALNHQVHLITERLNALERTVSGEALPGYRDTNQRLNECFHDLYQLRRLLSGLECSGADEVDHLPHDPVHTVEALFLHTRLPVPPARVLVCSAVGAHALDLASLGFHVTAFGCDRGPGHHPGMQLERGESSSGLPFSDGSFDVAVVLAGEITSIRLRRDRPDYRDLARVLSPGGIALGSIRLNGDASEASRLAEYVEPLRVVERKFASRAGHGWELRPEVDSRCESVLWVAST